mmetsp:Transcript_4991/g.11061  ORF Transcript_4991/g.11061 Transcript_4991/m.11061 type:complete len:826 (+) Transcript_4991:70-2547(+)
MLSTGAAALVGTVATVYTYNLGRFQFDANQAQNSAHQCQNMRLAQWSLFREDVRDLFGLTASNMSTYMVVGTLIVSCAMNFIWNGYKDYPTDPPWLLVIWNNTVFVCITFGLLSVWLAMHGAISSNSACAKILTQAVRPPIPTLQEVAQVRSAQEAFEGAGLKTFFQVPVVNAYVKQVFRQLRESARTLMSRRGREARREAARRFSRQYSPFSASARRSGGMSVLPRVQAVLSDADGGPGRSAVSSSHFWLLRQVQRSYACFDAYARISLSVSASQLLLVDAYYALGHFMSKSQGWPSPVQNTAAAWLAVGSAIFASIVIFRLDLFVGRTRLQFIQVAITAGPLVACVATHLSCVRTNFGRGGFKPSEQLVPALLPWALAIFSCVLHAWYFLVVRSVSKPTGGKDGLPLNFRSAHYLNVFGWHFNSEGPRRLFQMDSQLDLGGPTEFDRGVTPDDGGIASIAAEPFEVMAERPDSTSKARAMAWTYFSVTCFAVTVVWLAAVVVILVDPSYRESTIAPSEKYSRSAWKQLNMTFPHAYFRPFALGCTPSRRMAISDHFMIYVTDLPEDIKYLNRVSDKTSISDFQKSWKGVGIADWISNHANGSSIAAASQPQRSSKRRKADIVPSRSSHEVVFILHNDGATVEERAFGGDRHGELRQSWQISAAMHSTVDAIEAVGGELSIACKADRRSPYRGWGLMAATDRGHVMLLCPSNQSTLEPHHVVASLQRRSSAPWVVAGVDIHKILGVHVDVHREILWLMAARGDGVAEVRGWALNTGQLIGNWDLPTGRRWATGICGLGKSGGLLLGASAEFTPAAKAEVWHFIP